MTFPLLLSFSLPTLCQAHFLIVVKFPLLFFSLQSHNAAAAVVVLVAGEVANSILWSVLLY